ncbi:MAG: GFA family protein [Maritimibacter sp.]|nr:GFA family protein [Maritimibacter sp.]
MTDTHSGTYSGGCLCGASRFAFSGDPKFAIQCFCRDCQHVSGGGHLPQMAVDRAALTRTGPIRTFESTAASGSTLGFHFCADCGSPLLKTTTRAPDLVFVYPGALDDPALYTPGRDVFEDSRQPWDV